MLAAVVRYGYAARNNRRRWSGTKVHKLFCKYVVDVVDEDKAQRGQMDYQFMVRGKYPLLFSSFPGCGCCQGQHAGSPDDKLTSANVTCAKCATRYGC